GAGVAKIAAAHSGHGGGKEGLPIEEEIAAPADGPDTADGRSHSLFFRLVDSIPAEGGFDGIDDRGALAGSGDGLLVGCALKVDGGLDFSQGTELAGADAHGLGQIRGKVRTGDGDAD